MVTNHLLNEMINTEHSYRKTLAIINTIRTNLQERADLDLDALDKSEFSKGLDIIQRISDKQERIEFLFKALKAHLVSEDNSIKTELNCESFNDIIHSLKTALAQVAKDYANYSIFYENYAKNIAPKLDTKNIQRAINRAGGNHMPLPGLLINPIQRFPRYVMLFNELNKHTPQNHPAKQLIDELAQSTHETCKDIDNVGEFYANVKRGYAGIHLNNDSRFRRQVKGYLSDLMAGINQPQPLVDALDECGLTMTTKGKRFSNKREYFFTNQQQQRIFNVVVNRNSLSFQFTEHFDALPVHEKIALFRLQYFLTMAIENSFQAINVNNTTKRHLEILGEVEYLNPSSTPALILEDEDEDEDDDYLDAPVNMGIDLRDEIAELQTAPDFRQQLNTLFLRHKGLTRQGSLLKENRDNLRQPTYGEHAPRWKLPGLAR